MPDVGDDVVRAVADVLVGAGAAVFVGPGDPPGLAVVAEGDDRRELGILA